MLLEKSVGSLLQSLLLIHRLSNPDLFLYCSEWKLDWCIIIFCYSRKSPRSALPSSTYASHTFPSTLSTLLHEDTFSMNNLLFKPVTSYSQRPGQRISQLNLLGLASHCPFLMKFRANSDRTDRPNAQPPKPPRGGGDQIQFPVDHR